MVSVFAGQIKQLSVISHWIQTDRQLDRQTDRQFAISDAVVLFKTKVKEKFSSIQAHCNALDLLLLFIYFFIIYTM